MSTEQTFHEWRDKYFSDVCETDCRAAWDDAVTSQNKHLRKENEKLRERIEDILSMGAHNAEDE